MLVNVQDQNTGLSSTRRDYALNFPSSTLMFSSGKQVHLTGAECERSGELLHGRPPGLSMRAQFVASTTTHILVEPSKRQNQRPAVAAQQGTATLSGVR